MQGENSRGTLGPCPRELLVQRGERQNTTAQNTRHRDKRVPGKEDNREERDVFWLQGVGKASCRKWHSSQGAPVDSGDPCNRGIKVGVQVQSRLPRVTWGCEFGNGGDGTGRRPTYRGQDSPPAFSSGEHTYEFIL